MADTLENEYILLLICKTCKSIEEIPYLKTGKYLGEGKYDQTDNPFLAESNAPHERKGCYGMLTDINFVYWMTPKIKESIIAQIKDTFTGGANAAAGLDVFGTGFYDLKDTFSADAMSCWKLHNQPKGQCTDYKVERKLLKPDTAKERAAEGLKESTIRVYLCDFCPVKMYNQQKAYKERGLYE
jgi:uncharacterized protein YlaI